MPFLFCGAPLEQHAMDFVLGAGASYMEDDVRAETDKMGFCRTHYKKMYDYGNRLGAGLILKTHFQYKTKELHEQIRISLFAFPISEIWLKQLKVLYLIKRKKPFTLSFSQ